MNATWWHYGGWIVTAALLGFLQTFIFSDRLRLPRRTFLGFYVLITAIFIFAYARWTTPDLQVAVTTNLLVGAVAAVLGGAFLVTNVFSQPASQHAQAPQLAVDVVWVGVIYALVDALLLSIVPVHAARQALALLGVLGSFGADILSGVVALLASVVVTVAYHLGYPEFRGRRAIIAPIIGNSVCSLVYIFSGNLLAPILSHMAMHIAAVFHGPETTVQLPPHYTKQHP